MSPEELLENDIACVPPQPQTRGPVNPSQIANPPLAPSCGMNVTLVVDHSGSMGGQEEEMKEALTALLRAYRNTGSNMSIVEFGTSASVATGFVPVNDETIGASGVLGSYVNGYSVGGSTNWDDAFHVAHGIGQTDLMIVLTDGEPTVRSYHNHAGYYAENNSASWAHSQAAINETEFIKDNGTHIFAVGVGGASYETEIQQITGDVRFPVDGQTFANSDYMIEGNISQLANAVRAAAHNQCAPEVNVTKKIDADGDGVYETTSGSAVSGIDFTATISNPTQTVDWVRPDAPNNSSPETQTTDTSGSTQFQWKFGSVANPLTGSATVALEEDVPPGYSYQGADCETSTVDASGNNTVNNTSFSPTDPLEFDVSTGTIVNCDVYNRAETMVVLEKKWVGGTPGHTADLGISTSSAAATHNYLDQFNTPGNGYGSDGSEAWTDPWIETNDGSNSLSNGRIQIVSGYLQLLDLDNLSTRTITRDVDLTSSVGDVTITFDWRSYANQSAESIYLILNGVPETLIQFPPNSGSGSFVYTIPAAIAPSITNVGFRPGQSGAWAWYEWVRIDNFQLSWTTPPTSVATSDTSTAPDAPTVDLTDPDVDPTDPNILDSDNSAELMVTAGSIVNLSEVVSHPGLYTPALTCDQGGVTHIPGTTTGQLDTTGLAGETVTCTFTNTPSGATVHLDKRWMGGVSGDAVTLDLDGSTQVMTSTGAADETQVGPISAVAAGSTITMSETPAGGNTGTYTSTLSCPGATNTPQPVGGQPATWTLDVVAADQGSMITCTLTNSRSTGLVTVHKTWVNAASGDSAELHVDVTGETPATSTVAGDPNLDDTANQATANIGVGDAFTISEILTETTGAYDATYRCQSPDGTNVQEGIAVRTGSTATSGTLTMPDTNGLDCAITNTRRSVNFFVEKQWADAVVGDSTAVTTTATLQTEGPNPSIADTPDDNDDVASMVLLVGETGVTISETLATTNTAAYVSTLSCPGVDNVTWDSVTRSGSFDVPQDLTSDVTCTLTNTAQRGTIVVNKLVEGADGTFGFTGDWLTPAGFDLTTTSGSGTVTFTDVIVPADPNSRYTLVEADPTASYDGTVLSCSSDQAGNTTTTDLAMLTASIELRAGETVTCTYTNTERSAIRIVKDAQPDDDQDFGFSMSGDATATFTLDDDPGSVTPPDTWTSPLLPANSPSASHSYTITETAVAGWTIDPAASSCSSGDGTVNPDGTITVQPSPGTVTTCTVVNTAAESEAILSKAVANVDATYGWGPFRVRILDAGGNTVGSPVDISGTGASTVTSPTTIGGLQLNETYTVIEDNPGAGWATPLYTCSDGTSTLTDLDAATPGFQFEVTEPAMQIACTATNTASDGSIEVSKSVQNHAGDWSFDFALADTDPATADIEFTLDQGTTSYQNAQLLPGETYTLTETVPPGWTSATTCTLTPAGGVGAPSTGPWTIQPGDVISCSVVNTRDEIPVEVAKTWADPASTDDATLTATGDESLGTINYTVYDGNDGVSGTTSFWSGETINLVETLPSGNAADYTTSLECRAATATAVGDPVGTLTTTAGNLTGALTLPATLPAGYDRVRCTWTNTRDTHGVSVVKRWTVALAGEQANLSVNAGGQSDTATSTADGTADFTDSANTASLSVGGGDTVNFSETLPGANVSSYTTSWVCSSSGWTDDVTGTGTAGSFTMPAAEDVDCVITNTAVTATLHVDKVWINAVAGDTASVSFGPSHFFGAVTLATADGDNVPAPGELDDNVGVLQVVSGETGMSVSESLGVGNTAVYDQVLSCVGVDNFDAVAGTFDIPQNPTDEPRCTFTNTAQRGTIVISKTVDGAGGDFTFDSDWSDSSGAAVGQFVLSPPTAGSDSQTWTDVLVGQYSVAELTNAAYDQTVTCTESGPTADDGSSASGVTGSIDLDAGETVTCSYTNTERATVIVIKDADPDDDQAFEYSLTGGTVNESFSLVDDGSTPATNRWETTVSPDTEYTLVEDLVTGWDLDSVTCDTATTPVTQAGAEGVSFTPDSGQTITCTFVNDAEESQLTVTKTVAGVASSYDWSAQISLVGPGWTASQLTCTYLGQPHADEDVNRAGHQVTVTEPNSTVQCGLTNTATPGEVRFNKSVQNHDDDWSFDFTLSDDDPATPDQNFTLDQANPSYHNAQLIPGLTYAWSETSTPGWDTISTCTVTSANGQVYADGAPWTIEPGDSIVCSVINIRKTATMTVEKDWANPAPGDSASLSAVSETGTHTYVDTSPAGATDSVSFTVRANETVSLSEVMAAANAGSYSATALTCVGDTGTLTWTTGDLSATYDVSDDPQDVTCTWTNTRDTHEVSVVKRWVGAPAGDESALSLSVGAQTDTATSTADGAADFTDSAKAGLMMSPVPVLLGVLLCLAMMGWSV